MKYIASHVRSVAKDSNAVVVMKEDLTVGHVPRNLAPRLFKKRCQ